jgi:hypothetical protein
MRERFAWLRLGTSYPVSPLTPRAPLAGLAPSSRSAASSARFRSRHRRLTSCRSTTTFGACATSCSRHGLRPSRPSAVGSYRAGRAGLRPREKQLRPFTTPTTSLGSAVPKSRTTFSLFSRKKKSLKSGPRTWVLSSARFWMACQHTSLEAARSRVAPPSSVFAGCLGLWTPRARLGPAGSLRVRLGLAHFRAFIDTFIDEQVLPGDGPCGLPEARNGRTLN